MAPKLTTERQSSSAAAREAAQRSQRQAALDLLVSLDCLRGVPPGELDQLRELCIFRAFQAGAAVLGQQRHNRFLFLVMRGTLQLRLRDKDGREALMGVLARGDCCGEGPLFGDYFRRMNALAQSDCHLLQVSLADLRELIGRLPMLATALRQVYKRRLVEATLARVPLLSQLLPIERLALANLLEPVHADRGELVLRQGSQAGALYLIESGQVAVEQSGQILSTLGEGDFFGEIALLTSAPHRADVRAVTPLELLALPGAAFHDLIEQRPDLEAQLRQVVEQRLRSNAAISRDAARTHELELVVHKGILRGTHLLVRTPSLCPPDCRICEQACANRHGTARMRLGGMVLDGCEVIDACRQCGVGAECVEVCPEDAFERTETGTLIITDRCTGCGLCVKACPYNAVTSVPLSGHGAASDPLRAWLHKVTQRVRQAPFIPLTPVQVSQRADKCDLCHGHADLACVSQCPTGSLRLVPVEEVCSL
ncbi:MAG: cyclic nucleotide-binding domain-containing protein [Oscillochloridaceae bacterium umkhey_bin13]